MAALSGVQTIHELLMLFKDLVNKLMKQQDAGQWGSLHGDSCSSICITADAEWLGPIQGRSSDVPDGQTHLHKPRLHYNNEPQLQEGAHWWFLTSSLNSPKLGILTSVVLDSFRGGKWRAMITPEFVQPTVVTTNYSCSILKRSNLLCLPAGASAESEADPRVLTLRQGIGNIA